MPLILGGKKASLPLRHKKLNINIWNEQELGYLVYQYPLLSMGDFLGEELFCWIGEGLGRNDLADRLRLMKKKREGDEAILTNLLAELNFPGAGEIPLFRKKLRALYGLKDYEIPEEEGRILFDFGNMSMASERFDEAVRLLDAGLRRNESGELSSLRQAKAELLLWKAAVKMQLFDTESALKLIDESNAAFKTIHAEKMKYLISGSGDLDDKEKHSLDRLKEEAYERALESKEYRETLEIFSGSDEEQLKKARKKLAAWKKKLRKM